MRLRRKYIVNSFQIRLLLIAGGYFLFLLGALAVTVVMPLNEKMHDQSLSLDVRSQVAKQLIYLHTRVWPFMAGIAMLIGVHSVLVSHRVAGPLVRIRNVLASIRDGHIPDRVRLRRADLLHEEARVLEQAALALKDRVARAKAVLAELEVSTREIERTRSSEAPRLRARLEELAALLEALDSSPATDLRPAEGSSGEVRRSA